MSKVIECFDIQYMEAIHLSEYLVAVVIVQTVCGRVVWKLGQ